MASRPAQGLLRAETGRVHAQQQNTHRRCSHQEESFAIVHHNLDENHDNRPLVTFAEIEMWDNEVVFRSMNSNANMCAGGGTLTLLAFLRTRNLGVHSEIKWRFSSGSPICSAHNHASPRTSRHREARNTPHSWATSICCRARSSRTARIPSPSGQQKKSA